MIFREFNGVCQNKDRSLRKTLPKYCPCSLLGVSTPASSIHMTRLLSPSSAGKPRNQCWFDLLLWNIMNFNYGYKLNQVQLFIIYVHLEHNWYKKAHFGHSRYRAICPRWVIQPWQPVNACECWREPTPLPPFRWCWRCLMRRALGWYPWASLINKNDLYMFIVHFYFYCIVLYRIHVYCTIMFYVLFSNSI